MYIVIEMQKNTDGHVTTLVTEHATLAEAESKYHSVLAYAAVSVLPCHSAAILSDEGFCVDSKCYKH